MRRSLITTFVCVALAAGALGAGEARAEEDYIHMNKAIAKLEQGKLVTGIWALSPDPHQALNLVWYNGFPSQEEAMNKPMVDFIIITMEHYPYDISKLREFLMYTVSKQEVLAKGNAQPSFASFVRLPVEGGNEVEWMIKQALDVGCHGVVIPHVQNAEQARRIVKACRYPQASGSEIEDPVGVRGASPLLASYFWGLPIPEYTKRADVWPLNPKGDLMAIFMIEDQEGVDNIEEILAVPGVGAVFFGPYDFSFSSGNYGGAGSEDVQAAFDTVKKACDEAGVPMIAFANPGNIEERVKNGHKMLLIGSDASVSGRTDEVLEQLEEMAE